MLRRPGAEVARDSGYIFVIATIPGLERITQYWFGNDAVLRGHSVSFWTVFMLTGLATFLWFFSDRPLRLTAGAYMVPVILIATSAYTLGRLIVDNQLFNLKAFALILIIVLVSLKPPRFDVARRAAITVGLVIVLAGALSLFSSPLSLVPSGFNPQALLVGRFLAFFGIETRWEGPFGNVNYASIAGGLTVLLGLLARGPLRWFVVTSGGLMLLLAQGRAAMVALAAGLVVLALWTPRVTQSAPIRRFRLVILAMFVLVAGVVLALGDLSGGGRTYIWEDYLAIGAQSPIVGVGNPGIADYVANYEPAYVKLGDLWYLMPAFDHGHSIYIDQWARGGSIGVVLVVGALTAIGFFAYRRANAGQAVGLSLIVFAAVSGAFETTVTWNYLTVLYAPVFTAWMLSLETTRVSQGQLSRKRDSEADLLAPSPPESL